MPPFPVSATRLHECDVRLGELIIREASLFPFFDRSGRVCFVMLVRPASPALEVLEYQPERFRVPLFGLIEIDDDGGARSLNPRRLESISSLWHFDPWWVLQASRYADHPGLRALIATNAVSRFVSPVVECYYVRDLSRVGWIHGKRGRHSSGYEAFGPEILPQTHPSAAAVGPHPATAATGWRLDPIWMHTDAKQ